MPCLGYVLSQFYFLWREKQDVHNVYRYLHPRCFYIHETKNPFIALFQIGVMFSRVFLDTDSSFTSRTSTCNQVTIIQEDDATASRFMNSDCILYKFQALELDESLSSYHPEYHSDQCDHGCQNDIATVLFTRRNIEQQAKNFLGTLDENAVVMQELKRKLSSRNSSSNCCW